MLIKLYTILYNYYNVFTVVRKAFTVLNERFIIVLFKYNSKEALYDRNNCFNSGGCHQD